MKTTIIINDKKIEFQRNWFTGHFTFSYDGKKKILANVLNYSTHFSHTTLSDIELTRFYEAKIEETVITIIKTRPLILAGFRPHNYKFFINNKIIKEIE